MPLKLNDSFASFEDLSQAIQQYEKINRVHFWIRDAKKLHRAPPSVAETVQLRPELEYYTVKFTCIHGGKNFQPRRSVSSGHRKDNRGTFRQNCPAEIFVKLNETKNQLVVSRLEDKHNHDIPPPEIFLHNVRQKRKPPKENPPTFESLKPSSARSKNFEKISDMLQQTYSCTVDLQRDSDKITGFFFQDLQMKKCFELFPEILFLDGTYHLLNINCQIYIFSVENSAGSCSVVGCAILTQNNKQSIEWMLDRFKEGNPKWVETNTVVTDRDTNEKKIPESFNNVQSLICLSHAFSTFKKEVIQMKKEHSQLNQIFEFFDRLVNAGNEETYYKILEDMEEILPYSFTQYFYEKWHDLRTRWVKSLSPEVRNFVENKLEEPNGKLRATIASCNSFGLFVEKFFTVVHQKRKNLKNELYKVVMKVVPSNEQSEDEKSYRKILTPFAFEKIKPFLSPKTTFHFKISVTETACLCDFFTLIKLPCEHVLHHRHEKKLSLYDTTLFSPRWTKKYVQGMVENEVVPIEESKRNVNRAKVVCSRLAALCHEGDEKECNERLEILNSLKKSWEKGKKVRVNELKSENEGDKMEEEDYERIIVEIV